MKIFSNDFNILFDGSMCENLQELVERAKFLEVDGLNVGEIWEKFIIELEEIKIKSKFENIIFPDIVPVNTNPYNFGDSSAERNILNLFIEVTDISSTNGKMKRLREAYDSFSPFEQECLLAIINLTYSSIYVYNHKSKLFNQPIQMEKYGLENIISILNNIGSDEFMLPKIKKDILIDMYINSNEYIRAILIKILDGNLIPKVSEKTFFDTFNDSSKIRIIMYQRCEKESFIMKRERYPMMVQLKADGKFQNMIFDPIDNEAITLNRSGLQSRLNPIMSDLRSFNNDTAYLKNIWGIPFNLLGETLIKDPTFIILPEHTTLDIRVLERKLGNGLLNSYGKRYGTYNTKLLDITKKLKKPTINKSLNDLFAQLLEWHRVEENMVVQIWNMLPFEQWLSLTTDFTMIKSFSYASDFINNMNEWLVTSGKQKRFFLIWNEFVHSQDEIYQTYNRMLGLNMEGIVAKNTTAIIEHGVCTDGVIKFKDFKECDLRIIGIIPGDKQFIGGIGSFIGESECGTLKANVAGITMDLRGFERVCPNESSKGIKLKDSHDNDAHIGKIINVKFNELSKDKDGRPSLSLPSFVEFRDDVHVAMTYSEIIKQVNGK